MKKALLIGWKDLRVAFRDRAALVLMLAAPFLLALGLGLVTGQFASSSSGGLTGIPIVLVNQDDGPVGQGLVDTLTGPDLAYLLVVTQESSPAAAREIVEADEAAAAVLIPSGLSADMIPTAAGSAETMGLAVSIYGNPGRPISTGVVSAILETFLGQVETGVVAGQVAVTQLLQAGLITPADAPALAQDLGQEAAAMAETEDLLTLDRMTTGENTSESEIDPLALLAPGMALFFLMYTVSYGGRSLLAERQEGTLSRLLSTPTLAATVLGGKMIGIYLTGLAQMAILMGGMSLLFGLNWGSPPAMMVLLLATVAGAAGWGALLAALARTPGQVGSIGTALMLLFGLLGGSFVSASLFPGWLRTLRLITPNAWALDGLVVLAQGGTFGDVLNPLIALLLMGLLLFGLAVFLFRRRGLLAG
jgi:ABC-2 type transport system permease protein